jgi:hypothetical protein
MDWPTLLPGGCSRAPVVAPALGAEQWPDPHQPQASGYRTLKARLRDTVAGGGWPWPSGANNPPNEYGTPDHQQQDTESAYLLELTELYGLCSLINTCLKRFVFGHNIIKVFKNDLSQGTTPGWIQVLGVGFLDVKGVGVKPVFAFSIAPASMNVWWLVSFVGIEEQSPSANEQDRRHAVILNQRSG